MCVCVGVTAGGVLLQSRFPLPPATPTPRGNSAPCVWGFNGAFKENKAHRASCPPPPSSQQPSTPSTPPSTSPPSPSLSLPQLLHFPFFLILLEGFFFGLLNLSCFLPLPPSDADCSRLSPPATEKNPQSRQTFPHEVQARPTAPRKKGRPRERKAFC